MAPLVIGCSILRTKEGYSSCELSAGGPCWGVAFPLPVAPAKVAAPNYPGPFKSAAVNGSLQVETRE